MSNLANNKLISKTTLLLFIGIFSCVGLIFLLNSRAAVTPTNVGFETVNDPKCTGGINTTAGNTSFTQDNSKAYEGSYSAKASFTGGSENAYARCVVTNSWITGDEVWYGGAFFLPSGFSQSMQNQVDLLRWDNFSLNNTSQDWGGIIIQNSDKQARLKKFNVSGDYVDVSTPFTFPENRWVWVEVHQKFSPTDGQAINEVYIDGSLQSSSTKANTYGREITRIRYGLVAIGAGSQTNPLNLWLDRATISTSKLGPSAGGTNDPTFGNWKWNALNGTPTSQSISGFVANVKNPSMTLSAYAVATVNAKSGDPEYSIPRNCGDEYQGGTITARIPLGTKPDPKEDGHLSVKDLEKGTYTEFWRAVYDTTTQRIKCTSAAVSFPIDSVNTGEGWNGANAANTPLSAGLITPEDLKVALDSKGSLPYTLQFGIPCIPSSSYVFPANHGAKTFGGANWGCADDGTHVPSVVEGTWLRLDPKYDVEGSGLPAWQKVIARTLQKRGFTNRDNAGSFALYARNPINNGVTDNVQASWSIVGLTGQYAGFSPSFPWGSLQILNPPANCKTDPSNATCTAISTTPPPPPKKQGDVDGDTVVDIDDLSILLSKWNTNYTPADFLKDNIIDISDLSILLGNWGK